MNGIALTDPKAYSDDQSIKGMTVNERLYHFGLFDAFDTAVRSGQLLAVLQVLRDAGFNESQAQETAEATLASPAKYGF